MKKTILLLAILVTVFSIMANAAEVEITLDPANPVVDDTVSCLVNGEIPQNSYVVWFVNNEMLMDYNSRSPNEPMEAVHDNPFELSRINTRWIVHYNEELERSQHASISDGDILTCQVWRPTVGSTVLLGATNTIVGESDVPVEDRGHAPVVEILMPAGSPVFQVDEPIDFLMDVYDEDGDEIVHTAWWMDASLSHNSGERYVVENQMRHTFVYDRPGTYVVLAGATDETGLAGLDGITVVIREPSDEIGPEVRFNVNIDAPGEVCAGETRVRFDATPPFEMPTSDNMGTAEDWKFTWDFGDGTVEVGFGLTRPDHVYSEPGQYTVTLTVTDQDGNVGFLSKMVTVEDCPERPFVEEDRDPVIVVDVEYRGPMFDRKTACSEETLVIMDASRTVGEDELQDLWFIWDFGDGSPQEAGHGLVEAGHVYDEPGVYEAIVIVIDTHGNHDFREIRIQIVDCPDEEAPVIDLEVDVLSGGGEECLLGSVDHYFFDASGTRDNEDPIEELEFVWDFGDGSPVERGLGLTEVEHRYALPGVDEDPIEYIMRLIVTDTEGNTAVDTLRVVLEPCTRAPDDEDLIYPARAVDLAVMGVRPLNFQETYKPGDVVDLAVNVWNGGTVDHGNVHMTSSIHTLDLYQRERSFAILSGSSETVYVAVQIPYHGVPGEHAYVVDLSTLRGIKARGVWTFDVAH